MGNLTFADQFCRYSHSFFLKLLSISHTCDSAAAAGLPVLLEALDTSLKVGIKGPSSGIWNELEISTEPPGTSQTKVIVEAGTLEIVLGGLSPCRLYSVDVVTLAYGARAKVTTAEFKTR
ncbi:unnamed protein product, partial [Protopolystoma xenopodis]